MTESLRLAFLSSDHPRETARGTGHIISELARRFARAGHSVTVYYPVRGGPPPPEEEWAGVRTVPIGLSGSIRLPFGPNVEYGRRVADRLPADLDIVVGHNEWGGARVMRRVRRLRVSGAGRAPLAVQAFHGIALRFLEVGRGARPAHLRPRLGYYADAFALRRLEGGAARRADACLACSGAVAEEVSSLYRVPRQRIRVIYNGVEPQPSATPEERAASRRAIGLDEETVALLFVGEDTQRKGLDVAVRTVGRLRSRGEPVVLLNFGNAWPSSEGVKSFGLVDEATKRELFVASDVFFLPTRYEGLPAVVQEAAALRLPVVTTRAAHVELGSAGQDYLLLEPNTPEAAAELLLPLLGSKERRRALADAGFRTLGDRGYDREAEEYLAFFRELLTGPPG